MTPDRLKQLQIPGTLLTPEELEEGWHFCPDYDFDVRHIHTQPCGCRLFELAPLYVTAAKEKFDQCIVCPRGSILVLRLKRRLTGEEALRLTEEWNALQKEHNVKCVLLNSNFEIQEVKHD